MVGRVIGYWLGWLAADLVRFLRDKPFVPCQVDWEYREHFVEPLHHPRQMWPCE